MAQPTESDYRIAQSAVYSDNIKMVTEFLNSFDFEENKKFVKRVKYIPNPSISEMCSAYVNRNIIPRFRSQIFVLPELFYQPLEIFTSILVDHEGHHTKQEYFTKPLRTISEIFSPLFKSASSIDSPCCIAEIGAINNQILHADVRNLSQEFREELEFKIARHVFNCEFSDKLFMNRLGEELCGVERTPSLEKCLKERFS